MPDSPPVRAEAVLQLLRLIAGTSGSAEDCETRVILAAIGSTLPPPPPGAGGPFALSEPGRLEELASAAG